MSPAADQIRVGRGGGGTKKNGETVGSTSWGRQCDGLD